MSSHHQIIKQLLKLHNSEGGQGVYISNGFLALVEENQELIDALNEDERSFFDESQKQYDESLESQYAANQENVEALAKAEKLAEELKAQTVELEKAKTLAEKNTDEARQELREQAQAALEANRQKQQFAIFRTWWMPSVLILILVMMVGCFWLIGTGNSDDNMTLIFGTTMGAFMGAFGVAAAAAFNSLSANTKQMTSSDKSSSG